MDSIRVLIVDDLLHVRQGLAAVLRLASRNMGAGIAVVGEAQNGQEAIQLAQRLYPDVVLMDLEMPVLDGYAATRSLKLTCPSIGVVALTIHGDPASRLRAHQAGMDGFVEKGAPLRELIRAIQACSRTP